MVVGVAATGSAFGVARPNRVATNNGPEDGFERSLGPVVGELVERLRLRASEGHQAIIGRSSCPRRTTVSTRTRSRTDGLCGGSPPVVATAAARGYLHIAVSPVLLYHTRTRQTGAGQIIIASSGGQRA